MIIGAICTFLVSSNFYLQEFKVQSIDGEEISLSDFNGKVSLVVNTASKCGFTSQYEDFQKLYAKYKSRGFVVLGFPSNDFAGQEPGTNAEIKSFCKTNYGVTFPLFAKNPVRGDDKQPVFKYLTQSVRKDLRGDPAWNFEKFLISREGEVVARFPSSISPTSEVIIRILEAQLKTNEKELPVIATPTKLAIETNKATLK